MCIGVGVVLIHSLPKYTIRNERSGADRCLNVLRVSGDDRPVVSYSDRRLCIFIRHYVRNGIHRHHIQDFALVRILCKQPHLCDIKAFLDDI